ncbi:hypothetical protein Y032_0001g400 [Ancylostoma ceylanicum]|uniref:Uncharacterized protein n=1 Tax=Ancylostoma ceylanicum TaxID=53326 RepID=A0A016W540_9BILA|nr:hypothetical protein Y032_0001g400 [Ancylostoma ceylanicum]
MSNVQGFLPPFLHNQPPFASSAPSLGGGHLPLGRYPQMPPVMNNSFNASRALPAPDLSSPPPGLPDITRITSPQPHPFPPPGLSNDLARTALHQPHPFPPPGLSNNGTRIALAPPHLGPPPGLSNNVNRIALAPPGLAPPPGLSHPFDNSKVDPYYPPISVCPHLFPYQLIAQRVQARNLSTSFLYCNRELGSVYFLKNLRKTDPTLYVKKNDRNEGQDTMLSYSPVASTGTTMMEQGPSTDTSMMEQFPPGLDCDDSWWSHEGYRRWAGILDTPVGAPVSIPFTSPTVDVNNTAVNMESGPSDVAMTNDFDREYAPATEDEPFAEVPDFALRDQCSEQPIGSDENTAPPGFGISNNIPGNLPANLVTGSSSALSTASTNNPNGMRRPAWLGPIDNLTNLPIRDGTSYLLYTPVPEFLPNPFVNRDDPFLSPTVADTDFVNTQNQEDFSPQQNQEDLFQQQNQEDIPARFSIPPHINQCFPNPGGQGSDSQDRRRQPLRPADLNRPPYVHRFCPSQ